MQASHWSPGSKYKTPVNMIYLQDAFCEIFTLADVHGGELDVVVQDGLEKLVADPGAADESEGAQVGGVLSEKHERGGRDFRVSRNSQDFVDTDKELDNISELIVGGRQGDPENINDEVFLETKQDLGLKCSAWKTLD